MDGMKHQITGFTYLLCSRFHSTRFLYGRAPLTAVPVSIRMSVKRDYTSHQSSQIMSEREGHFLTPPLCATYDTSQAN